MTEFHEFPKWVPPHKSHIVYHGDHVSVPDFEHHVDRAGNLMVLCHDRDDEKRAVEARAEVHTETAPAGPIDRDPASEV